MAKHKVLSTKKLEPSLITQAKEYDIEIVEQEFISVRPIVSKEKQDEVAHWLMNGDMDVVFTSANAVEAVKNYLDKNNSRNFFCISGKTRSALLSYISNEQIKTTAAYGKDLAQKIIELQAKEVIFFCGNRRRDELPNILKEVGIIVHEVIVYETIETPSLSTGDFDAVLFFSPSAVESFFFLNKLKKHTACFAIGETTANSIIDFADNKIIISKSPDQETLLASVQLYFENSNCYE
ncbi:MAG: uroporphyrinogen-III synthase [Flavisolibacter sp.]